MDQKQLCKLVKTCNIVDDFKTEIKKTQQKKCDQVPITKNVCNTVQIPSPPQVIGSFCVQGSFKWFGSIKGQSASDNEAKFVANTPKYTYISQIG